MMLPHPRTVTVSLTILLLLLVACGPDSATDHTGDSGDETVAVTAEPFEPVKQIQFGADNAHTLFTSSITRITTDEPFRQITWLVDAADISDLAYRVETADGDTTDWSRFDVRWNRGQTFVLQTQLDEPAVAMEIRGTDALLSGEITIQREIVALDTTDETTETPADIADPSQADGIDSQQFAVAPSSLVISRSDWGASSPNKICGFTHSPTHMSIHHTAVPSNDGSDPALRMQSMQSYHKSIGWCDIGYHFVVSQSGKIYQGRSRSSRTGAHVSNNNTNNIGIALIGNYDVDTPPQAQLAAAAQIMEWVHQEHGVALNRSQVRGHQEWPAQGTSCPGYNLLNMLGDLVDDAADDPSAPSEPEPQPDPGGCTPTADDDATGMFADYNTAATGYDEAVKLYDHGITLGCSQSPLMFCPNCPLTRSQMVTFLVRAANIDTSNPPSTSSFDDVSTSSAAFPYIEAAYAAGITGGCGDGKFCPGEAITRAQAASMIQGARNWPDEVPADAPSFSDVGPDSSHYEAVETALQRCVTEGCNDGEFCPNDPLTRGQAAAFVANAFNLDGANPCAEPGGCSPQATLGATDSEFVDYPIGEFGYEEATLLADEGITQGCRQLDVSAEYDSDTAFCPDCPTTRRQMVMFLVRGVGLDTSNPPATPTFDDVSPDATGYAEIEAAYAAGITGGCGDGNFCPNDDVRRDQTATMIKRALQWDAPDVSSPTFVDVPQDSVHFDGVEALKERCVTDGCRADEFCPSRSVPRSHMAIFLARALNLDGINPCAENPGSGDAPTTNPDSGPGQSGGDECDDVDPDFIPASCDDVYDRPGDGYPDSDVDDDGDDSDDASVPGGEASADTEAETRGCTAASGSPTSLMVILAALVALAVLRNDQLFSPAPEHSVRR